MRAAAIPLALVSNGSEAEPAQTLSTGAKVDFVCCLIQRFQPRSSKILISLLKPLLAAVVMLLSTISAEGLWTHHIQLPAAGSGGTTSHSCRVRSPQPATGDPPGRVSGPPPPSPAAAWCGHQLERRWQSCGQDRAFHICMYSKCVVSKRKTTNAEYVGHSGQEVSSSLSAVVS